VVGGEGKLIVTGAGLKMSARGEPRFLERFDPRHPSPDNTR